LAAQWWGYKWDEWRSLPVDEQSFLLAVFETNRQIEAVTAYHAERKAKARSKKR